MCFHSRYFVEIKVLQTRLTPLGTGRSPPLYVFQNRAVRARHLVTKATAAPDRQRQVVLVSGGVESSTVLYTVHSKYGKLTLPLFFDYGQRASEREREAYRNLCNDLGLTDNVEVDLGSLGRTFRARQTERRHVPLIHRNGVLLSIATSLAAQSEASGIWIAICKDDMSWYASASVEFLKVSQTLLQTLEPDISLHTPLLHLSKAEVVQRGVQLNVPFHKTWSCMLSYRNHCGRCVQCRARKGAFEAVGIPEPSRFYER